MRLAEVEEGHDGHDAACGREGADFVLCARILCPIKQRVGAFDWRQFTVLAHP